jgi:hypothetical protein
MFKWKKGRQNTGYEKLKIFQFFNMDCYILRYNVGDSIPWHTDPVPGRKHFRLNIVLKNAIRGGIFCARYTDSNQFTQFKINRSSVVFFRSDITEHSVSEIEKGQRIVLTFGIAI